MRALCGLADATAPAPPAALSPCMRPHIERPLLGCALQLLMDILPATRPHVRGFLTSLKHHWDSTGASS